MNRKTINGTLKIFISIFLFALQSLSAQELLTLDEAVKLASSENLGIKMARNLYEISRNNVHIGNAGFLPRFDLSVSSTYNDNYMYVMGNKNYNSYTANVAAIKASYVLFDGMRNFATFSKLRYTEKLTGYKTKAEIENITYQTIALYYQIALLQENLSVAKESMEISRERMNRQKEKEKFGQSGSVDYLSAVVDFNKDSLNYIYVATQLSQAKQNLNKLLNREINTDFIVDGEVSYRAVPDKQKLLELALKNNADINASNEQIKISREDKKMAQSAYYPKLMLEGVYGYNTFPNEFQIDFSDPNKTFYTGLTLQFNIFNGFQNKIQNQNAEISLQNSELAKRQTELNLRAEISNAYLAYENAKTALELEKTSLKTAQLNFDRMKEMYDLGKVTLTQFREAQLKLIGAKIRISELKFTIKNNEANLLKLAGILISE